MTFRTHSCAPCDELLWVHIDRLGNPDLSTTPLWWRWPLPAGQHALLQKLLRNIPRNVTKSSKHWPGRQMFQLPVPSSIYGTWQTCCWSGEASSLGCLVAAFPRTNPETFFAMSHGAWSCLGGQMSTLLQPWRDVLGLQRCLEWSIVTSGAHMNARTLGFPSRTLHKMINVIHFTCQRFQCCGWSVCNLRIHNVNQHRTWLWTCSLSNVI